MTTTTNSPHRYPVRVDAVLDHHLSRGLWLVKWLAVIPHYVLLFFLWIAFGVLSLVALVAILATGRYPRGIFDFNVGVLRWSWRVAYYAYGVLGTDRYPPFRLRDDPDYPARLEVDYPDRLSRGLVLVKWWLLALPHYLLVAIFAGGGLHLTGDAGSADPASWGWTFSLIGLLVLFAAVSLLFTGRYPRGIFDLVLGLNRWSLRVAAYAGLMTDDYPPFRLDMGGRDPGSGEPVTGHPPGDEGIAATGSAGTTTSGTTTTGTGAPGRPAAPAAPPWSTGRIVTVVVGSVLLLTSGGLLASGATTAVVDEVARVDGFVTSPEEMLGTTSHAVTSDNLEVRLDGETWVPEALLGDARVTATVPEGSEVFVGLAPTTDVEDYLAGVAHTTVVDTVGDELVYRDTDGEESPAAPTEVDIWAASTSGGGEQELTWTPTEGDWTLVLMNADGSPEVSAEVSVGGELPVLGLATYVLLWLGAALLVVAVLLLALGLWPRGTDRSPGPHG